jgi:uncharacterized protein
MEKILKGLLKYPWVIVGIVILISGGFVLSMKTNSRLETDLDKYMPQTHPAFVYSNQAEEWFNIKDGIIIAIENGGGIYNQRTLEKVKSLTKNLQQMEEIEKSDVISLYTADNIIGTEMGLEVNPFFTKVPSSETKMQKLREDVRRNDMVYGRIVSLDEQATLIVAEIADDAFSQEFYRAIKDLAAEYEGPESLYVAGRPIVEGSLAALAPADMAKMVPIVILVIIIVLFLVMRSIKATVLTLFVVLFSVLWAFGLMAVVGIPIYAVSTMLPVMLIAIGVADGIHLFSHLRLFMRKHPDPDKRGAIAEMIGGMWKPVAMTSVTTAIGFVALLTSQVFPIKYFGLFTAFGVMMAMVFSLVLIPAGLMIFGLPHWKPKKTKIKNKTATTFSRRFTELLLRYKSVSIVVTILITALSIWGMTRVWIDSSFLSQFEKNSEIVQTDNYINQKFGGTSTLNVILDSDEPDAFKDPEILKAMERLQADVDKNLEMVGNSFALSDYLKRMNMVMNADDQNFNIIPDSRELIAQYLLLYEISGDPDNLWQVVDYEYRMANLTFQLKSDNSKTLSSTIALIEDYVPEFERLGISINYAGSGYKGFVFSDLILRGQIASIVLSLGLVIILLSLMFRNIMAGLIGSIPIMITAFISFGIMGLFSIPLSTTTALLTSIAIGIGIDYAVHFIERYRIYAAETRDKSLTCEMTLNHSGRAILLNALVVIAGFLVLLFSLFPPNRSLGALVSLNMLTSFVGTITIMTIFLVQSNIYFPKIKPSKEISHV